MADKNRNTIMADPELKLLGVWCSPFSRRIEIALNLKGIPYEYIEEDLHNKSPELLKYNHVHKQVPVLVIQGVPIAESLVILEYIDDTWKDKPLFPQQPYDKAMARFWAKFIDDKCLPSLRKALWGPEKEEEKSEEEARNNLKELEKELKGKKFFGGENIGYLDIVANFIAYWLDAIQQASGKQIFTRHQFPTLSKWKDDFLNCNAVKQKLPPWDRLVVYYQIRIEAAKALN
ncbi:glutathione S-transferase U8-like [Silene latifolia]|uniref:glutathione S-transferase U8-like n=1 Tax=Silene latifolia TaxID=37657 RepID=UPI003D76B507